MRYKAKLIADELEKETDLKLEEGSRNFHLAIPDFSEEVYSEIVRRYRIVQWNEISFTEKSTGYYLITLS